VSYQIALISMTLSDLEVQSCGNMDIFCEITAVITGMGTTRTGMPR